MLWPDVHERFNRIGLIPHTCDTLVIKLMFAAVDYVGHTVNTWVPTVTYTHTINVPYLATEGAEVAQSV